MKDLFLIRGLPGAGKTSMAGSLAENRWPIFSVDDYFTDANGQYAFKHLENHLAYQQCQNNVEDAMKQGHSKIFVHNTFTLDWEIEPYFNLAATHGYRVFVSTVENYHGNTNSHGISEDQVKKMADKYRTKLI